MISTILVSFSRDNALFASKAKINVVWIFFRTERSQRGRQSEKKFQTMLILVFEVIVQPPKTHFLTFSCETKIMEITHSAKHAHLYLIQIACFMFKEIGSLFSPLIIWEVPLNCKRGSYYPILKKVVCLLNWKHKSLLT